MAGAFMTALELLRAKSRIHNKVLVAYSGGKDSLVVLDLAVKVFPHVECFFMAFMPDLSVSQDIIDWPRKRYGIGTRVVQHPSFFEAIQRAAYRDPSPSFDTLEIPSHPDIYRQVAEEAGCKLVLDGQRKADGPRRKNLLSRQSGDFFLSPIREWIQFEVFAYLDIHKIPRPESNVGQRTSGIGLRSQCIYWLYDNHRDDYHKMRRVFPYIESLIRRREWFGETPEGATYEPVEEIEESEGSGQPGVAAGPTTAT